MRKLLLSCLLLLAPTLIWSAPEIMPFAEVQVGMEGTGLTSFEGDQIDSFSVKIVGKLPSYGAGSDLILAKLAGGPLDHTGVFAGMSGSPVYIDDKLVGAVAYAWGFSKDPIAGITPADQMFRVDRGNPKLNARRSMTAPDLWALWSTPSRWVPSLMNSFPAPTSVGELRPLELPLSIQGHRHHHFQFSPTSPLRNLGLLPMPSTTTGASSSGNALPLAPGSPIGVQLVRGDIQMTATGTVTWIDGDRIWAFGHPLFSLGATQLPFTEAAVQTILPNLMQSARFATAGEVRGAITQDRAAAIHGRLGMEAPTIPVRVEWSHEDSTVRSFQFECAADALLSPLLLFASLGGIVGGDENIALDAALEILPGSSVTLADGQTIDLDEKFSGTMAIQDGALFPAIVLYVLNNNPWQPVNVKGVQLRYAYAPRAELATIESISLSQTRAKPGDTISASVRFRPYRGAARAVEIPLTIPLDAPRGTQEVFASSATQITQQEVRQRSVPPADLETFIKRVNNRRRQGAIYLSAWNRKLETTYGGTPLPNLPPSKLMALAPSSGNVRTFINRPFMDTFKKEPFVFQGEASTLLEIEE